MANTQSDSPVWPRPREMKLAGKGPSLGRPLRVETRGRADWLAAEAERAAALLNRAAGRTIARRGAGKRGPALRVTTMDALPAGCGLRAVRKAEGYVLSVSKAGVVLAGADARGAFYGAQTLAQLVRPGPAASLLGAAVRDWPALPIRGAHVYLPPRGQMAFFERLLDYLAGMKCNTLFLEIGGGLAYERRPRINTAWRSFCRRANAYRPERDPMPESLATDAMRRRMGQDGSCIAHPAGPVAMQVHRAFYKNSPHTELAGGEWLTKDEARRIADLCRDRHVEVIPEVQSFSHSYYLCCAYPEIAERADDPFPDTYCPSRPKTYEVLFDVMDEVIEVFGPRTIHCGHDELYTIRVCPACRRRSGHELLAGDVSRIHDFLAARGVRTAMWGDKLMNHRRKSGRWGPVCGLAGRRACPETGEAWAQPATWKAIDHIPADVLILDWYWGLYPASERYFRERGFEVCFGNYDPTRMTDFDRRARPAGVLGAEASSWCEVSPEAFGHNGIFGRLFVTAGALWTGRRAGPQEAAELTAGRLPAEIDRLTGRKRWLLAARPGKAVGVDLAAAAAPLAPSLHGKLAAPAEAAFEPIADADGRLAEAIVLHKGRTRTPQIPLGLKARKLLLLGATTMRGVYFRPTFYSLHRGPAELLRCRVRYADGRVARFAAFYGEDIGPLAGGEAASAEGSCYRAVPVRADDEHTLYAHEWTNPRPNVAIAGLTIALGPDASDQGEVIVAAVSAVR